MKTLNITERRTDEATVLVLRGDIIFGQGNLALRSEVRRLIGEGKKNIFLDFGGVGYIDSSGVGELVSALTAVSREGGRLRLLNLPPRARQILSICKLLTIFEVDAEESEAAGGYR